LIRESLQKTLDLALETNKNVQQNNAQNAVLFEAINLIIHLDTEHALMKQISSRLGRFIQSRETNVRYLGLEAMTHLAARADTLDPIKQHQEVIIGSLKDRDISVRRKGLDLLYSMCDSTNARVVVGELLHYLQNADFAIREEMVLKIAILTEKYATDVQWYVDISLRLIAMAGDHVSDEVWQRVIQIISNNEELQVYAAQNILQYCKQDHCHETLVKNGAYILGEFGHLIAEEKGCSPIEQFLALQNKLPACSSSTRAMILSSFVKYINLFPEIKPQLVNVFSVYSHTLDPELQQRACEYLTLASLPTDDLLRTVCDEMPPFPERESALLSRLHQKHSRTSDKRTWVVGGKDANADAAELNIAKQGGLKRTFTTKSQTNGGVTTPTNGHSAAANDLAGLDMSNLGPAEAKALKIPNLASAAHLSPNWERGFNRLMLRADGVLYEDGQLQVGVRSEYRGQMACLILYFTNKTPALISSFTTTLDLDESEKGKLTWDVKGLPETTLNQGGQAQQVIMFEAKKVFEKSPTIRISYLAGALQALTLKLPVTVHKFMDPAELSAEDFFKRWKQIGGAPREAQSIFGLAPGVKSGEREMTESFVRGVVEGFRWGVLDGVDPNRKNFVGASVVHTSEGGKYGCLLRLEPNYVTQVSSSFWGCVCLGVEMGLLTGLVQMVRLTIRATDDMLPPLMLKMMQERMARGVSTAQERFAPPQPTMSDISDSFRSIMVTTSNR
jgi:AP-2 complex subunit alpha